MKACRVQDVPSPLKRIELIGLAAANEVEAVAAARQTHVHRLARLAAGARGETLGKPRFREYFYRRPYALQNNSEFIPMIRYPKYDYL